MREKDIEILQIWFTVIGLDPIIVTTQVVVPDDSDVIDVEFREKHKELADADITNQTK